MRRRSVLQGPAGRPCASFSRSVVMSGSVCSGVRRCLFAALSLCAHAASSPKTGRQSGEGTAALQKTQSTEPVYQRGPQVMTHTVVPSRCPEDSVLSRYVRGVLGESAAEELARHLER